MLSKPSQVESDLKDLKLKKLTGQQVEQIDELLARIEEHGEVHLIVHRGILKYVNKVEKYNAWKPDEQE
jgi:hypothetical protein